MIGRVELRELPVPAIGSLRPGQSKKEGVLRLAAKITEQRLEACFQARRQALTVIQGGQA